MANKYVLLNNVEHHNLRVITERSARYGDDVDFAMIFPLEFRNVQASYPIFFRKSTETGRLFPIALFGFQPRENLFLTDQGWEADYIPLTIRRQPFLIGLQQVPGEADNAVVSIDINSPRASVTEGEPLFLAHGGTSDFLASVTDLLETVRLGNEMSVQFVDALLEAGLIESVAMQIELKDGSKHELLGLYTINEDALQQLDAETLAMLHNRNYLESVFMVVASLSCVKTLVARKNDLLPGE